MKDRQLAKFIKLYKRAYGVDFSREEAERELSKLKQLYEIVYLPKAVVEAKLQRFTKQ